MKQIINGKLYDTDTAEVLFQAYWHKCLLRTPKGNYFFAQQYTGVQNLEPWEERKEWDTNSIRPASEAQAKKFVAEECNYIKTYQQIFGDPEEA